MASFYEMPSISPTMEVGTLVAWRVEEGATVSPQTVIAEVGTDKANMEAEVFDDGIFIKKLIEEGDEVPPGFPIAIVGQSKDEDITALLKEFEERKKALAAGAAAPKKDAPAPAEEEHEDDADTIETVAVKVPAGKDPTATAPKAKDEPKAPAATKAPASEAPRAAPEPRSWAGKPVSRLFLEPPGDLRAAGTGTAAAKPAPAARVAATPLARAVAADKGVDLSRVTGTGPGGRIVRADVESAPTGGAAAKAPKGPAPADEVVRNSPMRKTIAKRLLASHLEIPSFYLTAVFDATRMVQLREALKEALPDAKISYNDIVIACVGRSLREFPKANASWDDKAITRHGRVDVGMAVAIDDGLITPVIRSADTKDLATIASETRDFADRARKGKLAEAEYKGGTFTVSNLGMMGIDEFTAIINPPESAILAIGALQQEPVVANGQVTTGWRLKVTMTCDHRVIDGMVGAQFLQVLRKYAENPFRLLL